jgi:hypothetical protein
MASRPIPKGKPFEPPPDSQFYVVRPEKPEPVRRPVPDTMPGLTAKPGKEPVPAATTQPAPRKRRLPLLLLVLALLAGGATLLTVVLLTRKPARGPDKDADTSLSHLKELQRSWFDTERLGKDGSKDPGAAFSRLMAAQQDWWLKEGLAQNGNLDSGEALAKLEEQQRTWWSKEGLADGKQSRDSDAALGRLADINRQWWAEQKIAKGADTLVDDGAGNGAAPEGSDNQWKLIVEKTGTQKFLAAGGTEESEQAVQLGLKWLASQQLPDGRWTAHGNDGGKPRGRGGNDVASTALALLPFLAHGETHRGAEGRNAYSKKIEYGIKFLLGQMKADGDLRSGGNMYVHALATMALCQALDTSSDPLLREPCQKAIDFLVKAQDPRGGGFRYTPGMAGDMSVTSWCLMALKSGQLAGLHIPSDTIDKAKKFLDHVSRPDGGYNYVRGQPGHSPPTPAVMTAAGIVCRQYLQKSSNEDLDPRSPAMTRGVDIILKNPPKDGVRNFYYYYYATYALLPVGGDAWNDWNPKCRDLLIRWQDKGEKNPSLTGSWDPQGAFQLQQSGRVGVTALALLTLEVYYRHLPVNRPELGEMVKDTSKGPNLKK